MVDGIKVFHLVNQYTDALLIFIESITNKFGEIGYIIYGGNFL